MPKTLDLSRWETNMGGAPFRSPKLMHLPVAKCVSFLFASRINCRTTAQYACKWDDDELHTAHIVCLSSRWPLSSCFSAVVFFDSQRFSRRCIQCVILYFKHLSKEQTWSWFESGRYSIDCFCFAVSLRWFKIMYRPPMQHSFVGAPIAVTLGALVNYFSLRRKFNKLI